MIVHASVAKLYRHLGDPEFDRTMSLISSCLEEGVEEFEFDVDKLDDTVKDELFVALDTMGYNVIYDENTQVISVGL